MVNIYEQAIKPVVNLEDSVIVYVPGYSTIGPGEPTLCSTVSEFEGLFGSTPYLFEADQLSTGVSYGSPEKGYLYAKSLLSSGLKVLFHRFKKSGVSTAYVGFQIKSSALTSDYQLAAVATSFGKGYKDTKVTFSKISTNLYNLKVKDNGGNTVSDSTVSLDPQSSIYFKNFNSPLVKFMAIKSTSPIEFEPIEDSILMAVAGKGDGEFISLNSIPLTGNTDLALDLSTTGSTEFDLDGQGGMLEALANTSSEGMMYPLKDFERFPSVAYLTTGGYYTNKCGYDVATAQLEYAQAISAIALIDWDLGINNNTSWSTAKNSLAGITGSVTAKGKSAHFAGCNSFTVSPYRVILGDSFNYLKCLGENMKRGVAPWLPVANDPNGVSPLGYDTTQKIDTALAETMAEGNIGVSSNPIIYSNSAGGYKIMGNRTLLSNDGVLSPNSFLNIAVIVNRVARAARQTANKLKIVSTDPSATFLKFKQSVAKTIDPMVVSQDGVLEYKIRQLPKDAPATMNVQIHLVVLEGIEKFNIYIPYELKLD